MYNASFKRYGVTTESRQKAPPRAFTLIELLIVIAIIAILAALLLPALAASKRRGQAAACISNIKQLTMAWRMYADDNQDRIISTGTSGGSGIPWRFDPPSPTPNVIGMAAQDKDIAYLQAGYMQGGLYQYAPNVNVLHCPADARYNVGAVFAVSNPAQNPPGSFAYNSYSGAGGLNGSAPDFNAYMPAHQKITTLANLRHPSDRYVWIEENDPRSENESWWEMDPGAPGTFVGAKLYDSVASWHGNNSTFGYADGHAEDHHWLDPYNIAFALSNDPKKLPPNNTPPQPDLTTAPNDVSFLAHGYADQDNP